MVELITNLNSNLVIFSQATNLLKANCLFKSDHGTTQNTEQEGWKTSHWPTDCFHSHVKFKLHFWERLSVTSVDSNTERLCHIDESPWSTASSCLHRDRCIYKTGCAWAFFARSFRSAMHLAIVSFSCCAEMLCTTWFSTQFIMCSCSFRRIMFCTEMW